LRYLGIKQLGPTKTIFAGKEVNFMKMSGIGKRRQ
jgi:hypothetical protein